MNHANQQAVKWKRKTGYSRRSLADLPLSAEDFQLLRRQGGIYEERRTNGKRYYKLRFRRDDGRQVVFGLGADESVVRSIESELNRLQEIHKVDRRLGNLVREARQLLRGSKPALQQELARIGFHLWGSEIRKRRIANVEKP